MCISNLNKVGTCILKPPTEYRFPFYLDPFKGGGAKKGKKGSGKDVDEISIGGLFHKRQNFLFCVSHLILSNMPKAKRPHAHCLKNAQFMSAPPPTPASNNARSGWLLGSTSAPPLCTNRRREMRFKSEDTRPGERPGEVAACLFVPRCNRGS